MLQLIPKWKVTVVLPEGSERVFWIHDHFIVNVLRKVADMQFTENGLSQPNSITVGAIINTIGGTNVT